MEGLRTDARPHRLARVALAACALALVAADASPELPENPKYLPAAQQQAWAERLAEADRAIAEARARVSRLEAAYAEARHSHHPRGEALGDIETSLAQSKRDLEDARETLERRVEEGRRAGVLPGVLRPYWE